MTSGTLSITDVEEPAIVQILRMVLILLPVTNRDDVDVQVD